MDNTLKHHGILGMRWGVRRFQNKDGTLTPTGRKRQEKETKAAVKESRESKNVKSMSDTELRTVINRLQMEKQYSQLTSKERSAGAKFVTNVLTEAAKQTVSKYVSRYMTKGVDAIIETVLKK